MCAWRFGVATSGDGCANRWQFEAELVPGLLPFDEALYLREMDSLIETAKDRLLALRPEQSIYTVAIWTDPNSASSAVGFDTLANSQRFVAERNEYNRKYRERYLADGDHEMAALFPIDDGRCDNPADFAFPRLAETLHKSFKSVDEPVMIAGSDHPVKTAYWPILELLLRDVQSRAAEMYSDLTLHPDAVIVVNSSNAWYDNELALPS